MLWLSLHCITLSSKHHVLDNTFRLGQARRWISLVLWSFHDIIVQGQIRVAPHSFLPIYQESIALLLTFPLSPRSSPGHAPSTAP
jgi:hypothetical protein